MIWYNDDYDDRMKESRDIAATKKVGCAQKNNNNFKSQWGLA